MVRQPTTTGKTPDRVSQVGSHMSALVLGYDVRMTSRHPVDGQPRGKRHTKQYEAGAVDGDSDHAGRQSVGNGVGPG